ncbi:MAG: hypothetical protein CM1200mP30_07760 [Pseudomonadota bacterium]|nr:MAG: hypothetical protein CM1200mP30_07760 [Pseudomonadota bacterium]
MGETPWGALAIVPSAKKIGGVGSRLDIPITHINASYVRSHFDAMEVYVQDAPRETRLCLVWYGSRGRIHSRVGGLQADQFQQMTVCAEV